MEKAAKTRKEITASKAVANNIVITSGKSVDNLYGVQMKLNIGRPNDKYEQEADTVADQVMAIPEPVNTIGTFSSRSDREIHSRPILQMINPFIQRQPLEEEEEPVQVKPEIQEQEEEEELIQSRPEIQKQEEEEEIVQANPEIRKQEEEDEEPIQAKRENGEYHIAPSSIENSIKQGRGQGSPLSHDTRSFMESRFGADFRHVRVHYDSNAVKMNRELNARAFTHGSNIYFNSGRYDPGSTEGQRLLAHELTHVVQQDYASFNHQVNKASSENIQLNVLSDELEQLWFEEGKGPFFQRLRNLGVTDPEVLEFIEINLSGDDLWLARNIFFYGPEANWPIHLKVEREMKGWSDSGGISEVFNIIRQAAGAQAGNTDLTGVIVRLLSSGQFTAIDAWQAVVLQLLGNETYWPLVIRNFVDGVRGGQFVSPAGIPPVTIDGLIERAVAISHATAVTGNFSSYQGIFNSLWGTSAYSGLSSEFDPGLTSKGPRTERSRAIFNHIYSSNTSIRAAYDSNTGGIRELIDQYIGPESLNIIASPRLYTLIELFRGTATITATSITDPAYLNFKTSITPVAQSLDVNDRQAINRSHEWRLMIDQVVSDANLRNDLAQFLATAWQFAPAPVTVPATPPSTTAPSTPSTPAPTPLTLTSEQQIFVDGLLLQGPASPLNSNNDEEQLDFRPRSSRNQAGLVVQSRVEVTPAGQISEGQETQHLWPPASSSGNLHSSTVIVEGGTAGFTDFTASLTLIPNQGTISITTPPTSTVRLIDQRRAWFASNIRHGLIFSDQNIQYLWSATDHIEYYGGQQPIAVSPRLPSANRGLTVFMRGSLLKNGMGLENFSLTEFGSTNERNHLGGVTVLESTPPATSPDNMELVVEFFSSSNVAVPPFHTLRQNFQIHPGVAFTNAQLLAQAQADHARLNDTASGSILQDMTNMGGQAARISQAIQGNAVLLEPTLIRPDSATFLRNNPTLGNPSDHVAYLVGHTVVDNHHTLVGAPGADAWQWGRFPNSVFINLTPSLANPGNRRANSVIIPLIIHESVHAVDIRPGAGTDIERYKTEFRAYWMDGSFDHRPGTGSTPGPPRSTAFDSRMDNRGPKSEKARAIFNHLYGAPTYPLVKTNYDGNISHFREQVNAFIVPDGINMIVSLQLERIRATVDGYGGSSFAAHRANIQSLYNSANALDKREISGNRYWRALVEGQSAYTAAEKGIIKSDLNIPV